MRILPGEPDLPSLEKSLIQQWEDEELFRTQEELRKTAPPFVLYDGPPFANGLPHYGHVLASTVKDSVARYWTMRGFYVERGWGWDCHGFPVEGEVEKKFHLKGKKDIESFGVKKFNEACRESVTQYAREWQSLIQRMGRWINKDHIYHTMDLSYMETVWWVFRELYNKGLIYQDVKVVAYSPQTGSVVSQFEANQNYKDIEDIAIFVSFPSEEDPKISYGIWTTTPWTLPANKALAVNPQMTYVLWKNEKGEGCWVAKGVGEKFWKDRFQEKTLLGQELVGKKYKPLWQPLASTTPQEHQILSGSFVQEGEGTGIVHLAPAYGEDDFYLCQKNHISWVDFLDESGFFKEGPWLGHFYREASPLIVEELKKRGHIFGQESYVHSYPFDERTNTPLIYRVMPSWFVAVSLIKDRLCEQNLDIHWVPNHIGQGRMGTWLSQARDWAISRQRFWGTPLPVWTCKKCQAKEVLGSVKELQEKTGGQTFQDIHSHHMENAFWKCPCGGEFHRVEGVFDCWFESGCMPYAQKHYPFSSHKGPFTADFLAEGLDQTRGWFYTLQILSEALFGQKAFKNVVVTGIVCDENGKKMSKRHRNYVPPQELMESHGADSLRLYLLSSPLLKAEDLSFQESGVREIIRSILMPLWHGVSFLTTYGNAAKWEPSIQEIQEGPTQGLEQLDSWILSRMASLSLEYHGGMESYRIDHIISLMSAFLEELTNTYIRLQRRRFWLGDTQAFSVLWFVLKEYTKLLAPLAPFLSDALYRALCTKAPGTQTSVHLENLVPISQKYLDKSLEKEGLLLQEILCLGRHLRQVHKVKVRQILASGTLSAHEQETLDILRKYESLIKQELNLKNLYFSDDPWLGMAASAKPNLKTLGKKLGPKLPILKLHLQSLDHSEAKEIYLGWKNLSPGETMEVMNCSLQKEDLLWDYNSLDPQIPWAFAPFGTLGLDLELTSDLIAEGYARELVSRIQQLRKDAQLNVSHRIALWIHCPELLKADLQPHSSYMCGEVLAKHLTWQKPPKNTLSSEPFSVGAFEVILGLQALESEA